jgi:hypothetical protein
MNGCNIFITARLQNNARRGEQEKGDSCIYGEEWVGSQKAQQSSTPTCSQTAAGAGRVDIGGGEEAHRGAGHDEDWHDVL